MKVSSKIKYTIQKMDGNTKLFAVEGLLLAVANNVVINNNNLFATRLGASDLQISAVGSLPQLISMLVLIPGGLLTDRLSNKRKMLTTSLLFVALFYLAIVFAPLFPSPYLAFLVLLALSAAPMTIYNTSWQAYFSDVVSIEKRNNTLTLRTLCVFFIGIIAPLVTGRVLASSDTVQGKIFIHQSFFAVAAIFLISQMMLIKKIEGGNVEPGKSLTLTEVKNVVTGLIKNKRFVFFVSVAFFFYLTWQIDWTMFYIGQLQYLKLNEAWLSYVIIGNALAQFATMQLWGKINEKMGVRFGVIVSAISLIFFPLILVFSLEMPASISPFVFLGLTALASCAIAPVNLNIIQCLLQVVPDKNKTLCISVYTVLISLSNAIMPMAGVAIYNALGANISALYTFCFFVAGIRIVSTALWALRWYVMRKER